MNNHKSRFIPSGYLVSFPVRTILKSFLFQVGNDSNMVAFAARPEPWSSDRVSARDFGEIRLHDGANWKTLSRVWTSKTRGMAIENGRGPFRNR